MTKTITVRVDNGTKEKANKVFKEVGIDMSTAVNIFLKQVVRTNSIPFTISADVPNKKTIKALKELENGEYKSFSTIDELMDDLND